MKLRSPTILGLAFDDRSVACAQVHARGDRREQRRLGRFVYPADATPNGNPAACGAALKKFLDEHGFDARRAVVGVPAKWLIAAERELPPSDPEAALAILRMHGERMAFSGGELIVDVAGDPTRDTGRALLVGILKAQLDKMKNEDMPRIAEQIAQARDYGDLSENAEYDDAKNEQAMLEHKIAQLEERLLSARVITKKEISKDNVSVGSHVRLRDMQANKTFEYHIVGSAEANPAQNKLSNESPVGKAIMGKKKGEVVEVAAPRGSLKFKILEIKAA